MYFATVSSSESLPSSTSIIAATEVIGFDIEYRRKIVSAVHRQLGRDVANPENFEVDRLPVLLDQHDGTRNLAGRDLVADVVADALQPSLRKPCRDGRRLFCVPLARSSGDDRDNEQGKRRRKAAAARKTVSSPSLHRRAA